MNKAKLRLPLLAIIIMSLTTLLATTTADAAPNINNVPVKLMWERTDKILGEQTNVGRGHVWGPELRRSTTENYTDVPGKNRTVFYFDKARVEINNPNMDNNSPYYLTCGLLTKELVSGKASKGNNEENFDKGNPSEVQVAGDQNTNGHNAVSPTYLSFEHLVSWSGANSISSRVGQNISQRLLVDGSISNSTPPDSNVNIAYYEPITHHNIPNVFIDYGNLQGMIWEDGRYIESRLFTPDATYVFGLPISEPYWVRAEVNGKEKDVLVQLFERRVLTYTPTNPKDFQVEMGNVGLHYYKWRYEDNKNIKGDSEEKALLNLMNEYRQSQGLQPLELDQRLVNASKWFAEDMATKNYYGTHTDSLGRDFFTRIKDYGYTYGQFWAENINAGRETALDNINSWKNSPGHNAIMLEPRVQSVGLSRAYNPNATWQWYWVADFGGS